MTTTSFEQASAMQSMVEANRRLVRGWLYIICLLVVAMVLVGGATRLTDSGLSITEWKPVTGAIPPLSEEVWQQEFAKYQQIPEFKQINAGMDLAGFKYIYWWEWGHRFLGRFVGIVFLLPMLFFWLTNRLEARLKPHLVVLFLLGGLQGAIGWWMVASGLVNRVDVSQYRLAVHLVMAMLIFAYALWLARGLAAHSAAPGSADLRRQAALLTMLILLQIFLGGLVAGLDAGLAFNTWPKIDGAWVPSGLWVEMPVWLNLFENIKTVQFVHRTTGYLVILMVIWHAASCLARPVASAHQTRALLLLALVLLQVILGIITLLKQAPFDWSLMHQFAAIVLLGFAIAHWRGLHGPYPPAVEIRIAGSSAL